MITPIHGRDYLIDFYSILDVERTACIVDIQTAYRKSLRENHPDIVDRASPEIKSSARHKTELIVFAYQTLSDEEKRVAYDKQLAEFDQRLISKNGTPMLDPTKRSIDIDLLVSDGKREGRDQIMKQVDIMAGYSPDIFRVVETAYNSIEGSDSQLEGAYKKALEKKLTYLTVMEDQAWADVGIPNQNDVGFIVAPKDHLTRRNEQLEEARVEITQGVEERVLAIESGVAPKLLTAGGESYEKESSLELRSKLTEIALTSFDKRKDDVERFAKEKADVLKELLKFTKWEYCPKKQQPYDNLLIVLTNDGKIGGEILYEINDGETSPKPQSKFSGMSVTDFKANDETLQELIGSETNVAILYRNPELDMIMETVFIFDKHSEKK